VCEIECAGIEFQRNSADLHFTILADWMATMSRKNLAPNFAQTIESLRSHGFDVSEWPEVAGGVLVTKYGAGAVLAPASGLAAFAVQPGLLVKGQIARLLDRGFQKFIQTPQSELPATAAQLHTIHRFSEELKLLTGAIDLYNESLGTTSDLYQYDRLKGR